MNTTHDYCDVYYQPGQQPVFCYRSGLMVYEETLTDGILVSSGYNAAGYPLNVLSGYPTRLRGNAFPEPAAFNLEADGRSLDYDLRFVDFSTERKADGLKTVLTLDSGVAPVRIRVHTVLDGTQMFTRFLEVENRSDVPIRISRLSVLSGGLEQMDRTKLAEGQDLSKLYSVGYFDEHCWGREGMFVWRDLQPEVLCVNSRFGRDRFRHPLIFIRNNVTGKIYFSQIGWSGGCCFTVDYNAYADQDRRSSLLAFKAEITAYNPMMVLAPGEVLTTPEVHMGLVAGSLDDAVYEMHSHIRKSVLNMPENNPVNLMVGGGMGAEHDMSVETSKAFIRQFKEMGVDVFIIDAGWACPPSFPIDWGGYNGVNEPNPDRYPNGIGELSDYCHSLGMKFAMWIEIERLGSMCDLYNQRPEWIAKDIYGNRNGGYIDLTVPEAAAWAEAELSRMIAEYKLDLLRIDYNVSYREYFAFRDVVPGERECLTLRHQQAVYRLYGNLKRKFPHVVFENCAGGGGRTDLGMMKYFNHTWVSDCQKAPTSILITNGMTMALPPERVDRLFAGMGCHEFGALDMQMRNTMLTHMSLNVIAPAATEWNPVQMEFVRHSVEVYKNFIAPILPDCKVYHHTPDSVQAREEGFCAYEVASPDGSRGALAAFCLTNGGQRRERLTLRGINPGLKYKVTLDNSRSSFVVSGYELVTAGLPVHISASMASELVLYEAVE